MSIGGKGYHLATISITNNKEELTLDGIILRVRKINTAP